MNVQKILKRQDLCAFYQIKQGVCQETVWVVSRSVPPLRSDVPVLSIESSSASRGFETLCVFTARLHGRCSLYDPKFMATVLKSCSGFAGNYLSIQVPPPLSYPPSPAWEDRDPLCLGGELRSPPSFALLSPTRSPWSCAEPFAAALCVYLLGCGEIPGKPGLPSNQILGAMNDIPLGLAPVLSVRFKRAQTSALDDSKNWTCFLSWSPSLIYFSFKM